MPRILLKLHPVVKCFHPGISAFIFTSPFFSIIFLFMGRISLEDNYMDIIGKAQRGLNLADSQLASRADIRIDDLAKVKSGVVIEAALKKIAPVLGLGPAALVASARQEWYPEPVALDGLAQFTTPYYDMTVNAYLAWDPQGREAVAFDTGADARPMLQFIKANKLEVKFILLSHSHLDHVVDLPRLKTETGARAFICEAEPAQGAETFREGHPFSVGRLQIATRQTSGHSCGGTTYVVSGLARPMAVVGDALFAGSMGRGMVSYAEALANNRQKIMTLPEATILCPGHGPLTTVGEEKLHNPFFPECNASQANGAQG